MPKKSKREKGGGGRKAANDQSGGSDDEGSVDNEVGSVSSFGGVSEASTAGGGEGEEFSEGEQFEGKMKDAMELATEKSAATRIKGLDLLCNGLLKRYENKPKMCGNLFNHLHLNLSTSIVILSLIFNRYLWCCKARLFRPNFVFFSFSSIGELLDCSN